MDFSQQNPRTPTALHLLQGWRATSARGRSGFLGSLVMWKAGFCLRKTYVYWCLLLIGRFGRTRHDWSQKQVRPWWDGEIVLFRTSDWASSDVSKHIRTCSNISQKTIKNPPSACFRELQYPSWPLLSPWRNNATWPTTMITLGPEGESGIPQGLVYYYVSNSLPVDGKNSLISCIHDLSTILRFRSPMLD